MLVAGSGERFNWPRMRTCQGYNRTADSFLCLSSSHLLQSQWVSKRYRVQRDFWSRNLHFLSLQCCYLKMITATGKVRCRRRTDPFITSQWSDGQRTLEIRGCLSIKYPGKELALVTTRNVKTHGSATSKQQSSNLIRKELKQQVMEAQFLAATEETFWLKAEKKPSLYIHTCTCTEQSQDPFWPEGSGSSSSTCLIVSVIF